MANKVKFYHTWSAKNMIITVGVISLLLLFLIGFFYYPQISNLYKSSRFDAQTIGTLVKLDEQTIIRQTKIGNKVEVDHYKVTYEYLVKNKSYEHTDVVEGTPVNRKRILHIWQTDKLITVKFKSNNPHKSIIDLSAE